MLLDGNDITEADPDERARAGLFMAFQYPGRHPRRDRDEVPAHDHERAPRGARRGGDLAQGLPQDGRGGDGADQGAAGVLHPLPQRGLLGRREEAHGDPPARAAEAQARRARRDGLRPGHRRAQHRRPGRQHRRRGDRHGHAGHHPLPAHPAHRASRSTCTSCSRGGSSRRAAPSSSSSSRSAATAGSARRSRRRHEPARALGGRLPGPPAHRRRLPRLRRHVADPDPGDRGDGRLLPGVPGEHPPRDLSARGAGHGGLRGGAREGRRLRRLGARGRPSSPATPRRRSTSSPTAGAAPTSAPATSSW